jgi:hypothetical protein
MDTESCTLISDQNNGSDALTLIFIMIVLVATYIASLIEENRINY